MHAAALRALEFDRIVEVMRSLALTPLGAARLAELRPHADPRRVRPALAATTEGVRCLRDQLVFPLQAPSDLDAVLSAIALEGRALEPLQLLGLADFLGSVDMTRAAIRQTPAGAFPILRTLADSCASFERELTDIRRKIEPSGEVADQATPELRVIRERLRKQRARLRNTLESYLRGKETAKYLQDQIVTDRNGRYVLVVRTEHRGAIPGIVHGSSASGASLYLEPLSTVEINNEIVALEEEQAAEIHRILLGLSNALRSRALDLKRTLEAAVELDVIQAKARFAQLVDGIEPLLSSDGRFELRAARHPLLIRAATSRLGEKGTGPVSPSRTGVQGGVGLPAPSGAPASTDVGQPSIDGPVPVDLVLTPPTTTLVVTGPNTGGKTVALKTAGLLALMAQAGLHVPAAPGSQLPIFRSVFADIGDEQSIVANLSTFSWHVTNIVAMDHALALPALVLLDEVGAGTDPVEGGALGIAVIEHFRHRGAQVIATTHYDAVKSYASTTGGVDVAAFGFDPESFAPTYQLVYGSPGRSLALEIAAQLGLAPSVIAVARQQRSDREAQLAEHLAKMDHDLQQLEHERRLVAREREQLAELGARLAARDEGLRQREEAFRRRLEDALGERLREARSEVDTIIDDLRRRAATLAAEAARRAAAAEPGLSTGELGGARAAAHGALGSVAARYRQPAAAGEIPVPRRESRDDGRSSSPPTAGDRVMVATLGVEGQVQLVHEREAEVEVRGKRIRVRLEDLTVIAGAPDRPARVSVTVQLQPREGPAADLNVIGCTVDEALTRAEKFLDEALIAEQRTVRLIHGHGTGQLRRALAEFLQAHPLVERFEAARPEQGGTGVTVVALKE